MMMVMFSGEMRSSRGVIRERQAEILLSCRLTSCRRSEQKMRESICLDGNKGRAGQALVLKKIRERERVRAFPCCLALSHHHTLLHDYFMTFVSVNSRSS